MRATPSRVAVGEEEEEEEETTGATASSVSGASAANSLNRFENTPSWVLNLCNTSVATFLVIMDLRESACLQP